VLNEAIQAGERIEIQNFLALEVHTLTRRKREGKPSITVYRTLRVRPSKRLRVKLLAQVQKK
jgi:nucleoid DNA-binding protein